MSEESIGPDTVRITIESSTGTLTYHMESYTYKASSGGGGSFRDIQIHAWAGLHAEPCPGCGRRDLPEHGHLTCYEVRFYPGENPRDLPFSSPVRVCAEDPWEAADLAAGRVDARALVELVRGKNPAPFSRANCLARVQDAARRGRGRAPTWVLMQTHGSDRLFALPNIDPMTRQAAYLAEEV